MSVCRAADEQTEILNRARRNVATQLARSANYTCVEKIDREYYSEKRDLLVGCAYESQTPQRREIMHDRLHMDLAVSEGGEIYGWHGEPKLSSSPIVQMVQSGPVSSGSFVGYLRNIFLVPGTEFTYRGEGELAGLKIYKFDYHIPLASSGFMLQGRGKASRVPFHGSFTISAASDQLTTLQVAADGIPADSQLCSAETEITYQMVNISGTNSLIPATFILRVADENHIYTVSRSEYSQCREFRGESTLRFDADEGAPEPPPEQRGAEEWLPAGIPLRVRLETPIDDRTSYTGDAVEGVLQDTVRIPGTATTIPKGAVLRGIITNLVLHDEPWRHYRISIQFERLTYGNHSLLLKATVKTPLKDARTLHDIYGPALPSTVAEEYHKGVLVVRSAHFRLDRSLSAQWVTAAPPESLAGGPQVH